MGIYVPVHVIFLWISVSFCGWTPASAILQRVYSLIFGSPLPLDGDNDE
jgi:hypothetical protein